MKLIYKNNKYYCPICGSQKVYVEVSILARQSPNTNRIYDISKEVDNYFWGNGCGCERCVWTGGDKDE